MGEKNVQEQSGISLVKKGKKSILSLLFSRITVIFLLLFVQIGFLFSIFQWFETFLPHIFGGTILFMIFMVLYLLNSSMDPTAKITWLVIILLVPVFGGLLYLYIQSDLGHRALKQRTMHILEATQTTLPLENDAFSCLEKQNASAAALARYMRRSGCFPVYNNTEVTYFPLGEKKFEEMLRQLKKAKHFIFMEYFIINEGKMWGNVLEILAQKAAEGVDVRVMYDGTCEFSTLPHNYPKQLKKLGISCKTFAPITPFVSTHYNYRDHRKILVIDGHTAFTGGVNLADEYINHTVKYGHWKDTAVMLQGDAAQSFTLLFLQMWNLDEKHPDYSPCASFSAVPSAVSHGFVIPYGDCPVDNYKVGEQVYIDLLNRAKRYIYIMTPYLILDSELERAITYAAQRGVDVRFILPGIPDKKMPYALAFTHYHTLLDAGVKIGEYTPGFVHAKVVVCDDAEAVVGTINFDYRSLYHHFECAVYMYDVDCIPQIHKDYLETWEKCRLVSCENMRKEKGYRRLLGPFLKPIAPLM